MTAPERRQTPEYLVWAERVNATPCSIPCCEAGWACNTHDPMHDERPVEFADDASGGAE